MIRSWQSIIVGLIVCCCLTFFIGCEPDLVDQQVKPIRVGVIISKQLDGEARADDTVSCAELIAASYNQSGGVLVEGVRYPVELSVVDYGDDPIQAVRVASNLIHNEGIRFFIGPNSDRSLDAVAPLYQAAGALFVHSANNFEPSQSGVLGVLGVAGIEQSLPQLCEFLKADRSVQSVAVVAGMQSGAIQQKMKAEGLVDGVGIEVSSFDRYDVYEEVYNYRLSEDALADWFDRVLSQEPDAIFLCGFLSEIVPMVLQSLKELNYEGEIAVLDGPGPGRSEIFDVAWEGVFFLGGVEEDATYSDYYHSLRDQSLDHSESWSLESGGKLYALETILLLVQAGGIDAFTDTRHLLDIFERGEIAENPFYADSRSLRIIENSEHSQSGWRLQVPVYISEVVDGTPVLVRIATADTK